MFYFDYTIEKIIQALYYKLFKKVMRSNKNPKSWKWLETWYETNKCVSTVNTISSTLRNTSKKTNINKKIL